MPGGDRFVIAQGSFLDYPSFVYVSGNPMSDFSTGFCSFHLLHSSHVTGVSVLIRSHHVKNILHNVIYTFLFSWYKLHNATERILFLSIALSVDSHPKSDEGRNVLSENAPYRYQGENSLQNCILRLRKNVHSYQLNTFNQHVKRMRTVCMFALTAD